MPRVLLLICFFLLSSLPVPAADWPQFRGPDGQGHSSERDLPPGNGARTRTSSGRYPFLGWVGPHQ